VPISPKFRYGLNSREGERLGKSVDLPHGLKQNQIVQEDIDPYKEANRSTVLLPD